MELWVISCSVGLCATLGFLGHHASVEGLLECSEVGSGWALCCGTRGPGIPLSILSLLLPAGNTD